MTYLLNHNSLLNHLGDTHTNIEEPIMTESDVTTLLSSDEMGTLDDDIKQKLAYIADYWIPNRDQLRVITDEIRKNNRHIYKFEMNKLVNHLNKLYNSAINDKMILYSLIVLKEKQILDFAFKNHLVYVKPKTKGGS